jgi:hypothetical protein
MFTQEQSALMVNVVHVNRAPYDLYVGRHNRCYKLNKSKWHNPFRPEGKTDADRIRAVLQFCQYLLDTDLIDDVGELRGLKLACWCSPDLCHAHPLAMCAASDEPRVELQRIMETFNQMLEEHDAQASLF